GLLGGEGGRGPGPVVIAQEILDQGQELLGRSLVLLGRLQGGGGLPPTVAPQADGQAGKAQPPGHGPDTGGGRQGQQGSGATDQPPGGRLPSPKGVPPSLFDRGNQNSSGPRSRHSSTRSTNLGAMNLETMLRIAELTG